MTYRPAHEAFPSYTNISRSREYWNKSVGSCVSCCDAACNCSACRGGTGGSPSSSPKRRSGKWSSMKRTMSGAPKPIHRVKIDYTVEDILHIEPLSADGDDETDNGSVWIRGIGNCHALRIYLRPKFGSSRDNGSQGIVDGSRMGTQEGDSEPRIMVEHVSTEEQQADIFTKPLPRITFQYLRLRLCGW